MASKRTVDYVVVGAGSAGCVVANRLSADENCTVLLLEAGGWDDRPEIHKVDAASVLALLSADWSGSLDWKYRTLAEPGLNNRSVAVARGRVVGGCSSINALMWVRGNRWDYDNWSSRGSSGWAFRDVLPYFKRAEDYDGGASAFRGAGGPLSVRSLGDPSPIAEAFVAGAQELGYYAADTDYNGATQEGFGFFYQTTRTRDGRRASTAEAYLRPSRSRGNLLIETGARATRVLLRGSRACGVEYVRDGQRHSVGVEREVVLSAGAFETPKLLMLSGVGPAEQLDKHGIGCHHNLPGVGQNLQDHLFLPVCFESRRDHPHGAMLSEAGLFTRTSGNAGSGSPDLQFTFGPVKFLPAGAPTDQQAGPGFTFAPVGIRPVSRGTVTLRDHDPSSTLAVRANYLAADADADVLVYGLGLARDIASTQAFDDFRGAELGPGEHLRNNSELRDFVRANATTLWHPVGTCRMGTDPLAVVDPELRVHGLEGLRVADASIMPEIVAGNTNAACVMIGERAADLLKKSPHPGLELAR